MLRMSRRVLGLAVVACLVVAAPAAAKSYKINMKTVPSSGAQSGTKLTGAYNGTPFGSCKMTGTLVIPDTKQTWACKGGTLKVVAHSTSGASDDVVGTWTMSSGTGKFRGIKGKGKFTGTLSGGNFTYTGTASW